MKLLSFLWLTLLMACLASGQQIGVALVGGDPCPVFVWTVADGSPAERAGLKSGDILVAVAGIGVTTVQDAATLLRSETQINLELVRGEKPYATTVRREGNSTIPEKRGYKTLKNGMIVPLDATEKEMQDKMEALRLDRFADRVFPTHYPKSDKLFYPGFEVLVLKDPSQVAVLGIEDGPASRAGVHWGDTIVSVNGVDPRNKSVAALEELFSSEKPAAMTLKIDRDGVTKVFKIDLAQAAQVLRDNQLQFVHGKSVPIGIPEKYASCFD